MIVYLSVPVVEYLNRPELIRAICLQISIYLLEVVADKYKVDTAEPQLCDAEEDVNHPPGSSGSPPQPRTV